MIFMFQFYLQINPSLRLSIYDFGGNGPPIIFCHFTGGLGRLWESVIARLKRKYHCFAYDARGHGDSSKPSNLQDYDWEEHLADLIHIIYHIKQITKSNRMFGVGHSFGSACLSQAVIKTKKEIHWEKIILIEPILGPETFDFRKNKMSEIAQKRRGHFNSLEEIEHTLRIKEPYKLWETKTWNIFKKHGFIKNRYEGYSLKCTPEIESFQYLYGNPPGWFENLKKIDIPTYLIYGLQSYLLPLSIHQLKQLPNAYLIKIPNVGHFLPQENSRLLSALIKKWFV